MRRIASNRTTPRRGDKHQVLAGGTLAEVGRRLEERAPRRLWYEQYGPDGEILEAWEGRVVPGEEPITLVQVSGTGYAEPRGDWRERGVTPPRGIHWAQQPSEE